MVDLIQAYQDQLETSEKKARNVENEILKGKQHSEDCVSDESAVHKAIADIRSEINAQEKKRQDLVEQLQSTKTAIQNHER